MISPAWQSAPLLLAGVLVLLFAALTWRAVRKDRREYRRFKRFRSTVKRQRMYRKWLIDSLMVFGGSSVIVLVLAGQFVPLLLADVNGAEWVQSFRQWFASSGVGPGILIGAIVTLVAVSVLGIVAARNVDTVPAVGDIQALLPRNRAELGYGAALSINAGVVEELLFRLGVPALLFGVTGNGVVSIVLSLALFGLLHVYQGPAGVIGSTILGGILMAVYLATGNIFWAIVLHALIDLRSLVLIPVVLKRVHRRPGDYSELRPPRRPREEPTAPVTAEGPTGSVG